MAWHGVAWSGMVVAVLGVWLAEGVTLNMTRHQAVLDWWQSSEDLANHSKQ